MANTQDYSKMMQDMIGAFPMDMNVFQDAFKTSAEMNEKFAKVALEAADKSAEISTKWTKDTLAKLGDANTAKTEPGDMGKAMSDFASAQSEAASENMAAFAEIAKKVQMDTVELMLASGQDLSKEATKAAKKATASAK